MRVAVVILSLFAVTLCAPTGEKADLLDVDSDDIRVKRAKEIMMFGNQQNEQKDKAKRADQAENIDEKGYIVAKEAKDLESEEESENTNVAEETVSHDEVVNNEDNTVAEEQESQETETSLQDTESTEIEETDENTELEPVSKEDDNVDDQMSFEDYLKELGYFKELENMRGESDNIDPYSWRLLKDKRDPYWNQKSYGYYNSPYSNYQRYRRSQVRALKNMQFPAILKRGHRAKRQAYYVPDVQGYLPYDDRLMDTPYNNYPMTEEDLAELLDVLDDAKPYDDGVYVNPYEGYAPYDEMSDLEFESPIYVPKRQAGLTFVPGIKRNRAFYPYFDEPRVHFSAFVPDKRSLRDEEEAYETYERLMELGAALRQQNYFPEEY